MLFYKVKEDNTVSIYRAFGENGIVDIPDTIDGYTVTEIEEYCFAASSRVDIDEKDIPDNCHVQAGEFVELVRLPDTISKIGRNAFYNCRKLEEIKLSGNIEEIGGDIFMNCINLSRIILRCDLKDRTCLKQILSQISWSVEVEFEGKDIDAVLFYPEYFEVYDEIGPAHIFELNISGEGFRIRQCFQDGVLRFDEYDGSFPQACAEEPTGNLVKMAINRIVYQYDLTNSNSNMYVTFLKEHTDDIVKLIFRADLDKEKQLYYITKLAYNNCFSADDMNSMIEKASSDGLAELSVNLLKIKSELFKTDTKSRYSFEDF